MPSFLCKLTPSSSSFKTLLLLFATITALYFLLLSRHLPSEPPPLHIHNHSSQNPLPSPAATTLHHLLFSLASTSRTLPARTPYVRLWYAPPHVRAFLFLDRPLSVSEHPDLLALPPVVVSSDTTRFPYTYPRGLRSAIRVARIVKEAVHLNESGVRWYVFGDDDTVFFVDNLAGVLSKYDHRRWFYVGSCSESYEQNQKHSFDMAYGGGGFAISASLAEALAAVLDSCLMRYGHLYGGDERIYSCVAELGVGLTREPGFHQVDMRGNLFGMLSAHPLSPLLSLHHVDTADPIFPKMSKADSIGHLFEAARFDPYRVLQQTVCYDSSNLLTVSVSWGHSVQVYEGHMLLPDLLPLQKTFMPWRRNRNINASHYMFNTRMLPKDPCKNPVVYFLQSVVPHRDGALSSFRRFKVRNCFNSSIIGLEHVRVFSKKIEMDVEELKSPRRQCCSVRSISWDVMVIDIRLCGTNELISMQQ
uniref:Uncharacterized protein n=1 Tax=Kalanchoe fedtschenkoi TaxID=63787 RepID=A0A7N0TGA2_KALFE